MNTLSIAVAFTAGLVSFLSPCVLPIIPGFLAYLAGTSTKESETHRRDLFLASLFFVLGFSSVFSLLGVLLNSILDRAAADVQMWLARLGGLIIIVFGLSLADIIHIPWLEQQRQLSVTKRFQSRQLTSFLFGAAFAAGWTPCVGAVLGAILGLAAAHPGSAFTLLFVYSLGLGVPFLFVGLFASRASSFFNKYARAFAVVRVIFGLVLVALGIFAFTENLTLIANLEILNRFLLR